MSSRVKLIIILFSALILGYGLVGGMMKGVAARDDVYADLSLFTDVLNKIKQDYVETPDLQKAMTGALHGMMEALDPYSSFVDSETYQRLSRSDEETAGSPGLVISKRFGYAYVVSVIPRSPAEREGLRSGDLLESIDGRVTTQMSLWEAEQLLQGPVGTSVPVRVVRARRTEPADLNLAREELPRLEVTARIVEEGIGLLQISHFEKGAADSVSSRLKMLEASGVEGLMIDLRGTALGTLSETVKVADMFLAKGQKIVSVTDRRGKEKDHLSTVDPIVSDVPIVLLLDGSTSGVAEVFAAALQDNGVAETVGEKTNGRGSVQEVFNLEDGAALLISTQIYHRATGKPIQDQNIRNSGVMPDIRSPNEDFVSNFLFENASDDSGKFDEDFYRKLNEAIQTEQFGAGLKHIRSKVLKRAA
jgi:carboxyl-terminal processing protease